MKIHNKLGMRTALAAGIAGVAVMSGPAPATANGSAQNLDLTATVAPSCTLTGFSNNGSLTIDIMQPGLPSTTPVSAATEVTCNTPATVRLDSDRGGMLHNGVHNPITPQPGMDNFSDGFGYTARVKLGGSVLATLDTDESTFGSEPTTDAPSAIDNTNAAPNMSVDVEITPKEPTGGAPLMAGTYTETLTLRISPDD